MSPPKNRRSLIPLPGAKLMKNAVEVVGQASVDQPEVVRSTDVPTPLQGVVLAPTTEAAAEPILPFVGQDVDLPLGSSAQPRPKGDCY